jgi:hypothetical protein
LIGIPLAKIGKEKAFEKLFRAGRVVLLLSPPKVACELFQTGRGVRINDVGLR